ncbi:glycosyltransferase family 4 protein [Paenibacillus filicis]|uniref:Glycosyltransferase family 4 protein n=1 Tax=Paenibacillus gyeongsangnamensis TaxID=3388067 RepID=A0ABT4QI63_9BACL|nr:glycosyltransferase family 4 protein [Paenibacillus filicis]MCZ8516472.1 glycosyltransferase family 4 protein [Paenibacillus filicis]
MRILQIADEFNSAGGLERFIYNFSIELMRKGHETTLAALKVNYNGSWGEEEFHTVALPEDPSEWAVYAGSFRPDLIVWHGIPHTAKAVELLASKYPTVATIHSVMCPSGMRLYRDNEALCMKRGGYSCILNWYARKCGTNISPVKAFQAVSNHLSMISALKQCIGVYAVSKAISDFLMIEGIPQHKIQVFDNTLKQIEELRPLILPEKKREIKLLYVGRLVYSKGVQYLLQAIPQLLKKGIQVNCNIIGDGWYSGQLHELTRKLQLEQYVQFVGRISGKEINQWYAKSDVVVVPSIYPDPAPLVVPEARKAGKPVVVFDAGGLPEWADFMDGVYIARRADAAHLADTIANIIVKKQDLFTTELSNQVPHQSKKSRVDLVDAILGGVRTGA